MQLCDGGTTHIVSFLSSQFLTWLSLGKQLVESLHTM